MRFTARVEPELAFDAYDTATGGALGEIYVWDAHPVRAERQRMMALETGVPPSLLDETALKKAILDALPHQKPTLERYPNMMNSLFLGRIEGGAAKGAQKVDTRRAVHRKGDSQGPCNPQRTAERSAHAKDGPSMIRGLAPCWARRRTRGSVTRALSRG